MLKFTCSIVVYSKNSLILSSDKYITLRNCLTHVMSYENLTHLTVFDNSPLPFFNNIVAFSDKISYVTLKVGILVLALPIIFIETWNLRPPTI